jgi:hypothetical protein
MKTAGHPSMPDSSDSQTLFIASHSKFDTFCDVSENLSDLLATRGFLATRRRSDSADLTTPKRGSFDCSLTVHFLSAAQ